MSTPTATAVLEDAAAAVAGLDALDTPTTHHPPLLAPGARPPGCRRWSRWSLFLGVWQAVWASAIYREYKLPGARSTCGTSSPSTVADGSVWSILWTSVHRAVLGFVVAVVIATPLGLLVAKVPVVRAAIGPLLSGPAEPAVGGLGAGGGAVVRADRRHDLLRGAARARSRRSRTGWWPASTRSRRSCRGSGRCSAPAGSTAPGTSCCRPRCPATSAGCKQGWAFSWRSLMAAEIIAASPQLGVGLGAYLKQGSDFNDMPAVIAAIFLILLVGVGIELLVFRPLERRVLRARGLALAT